MTTSARPGLFSGWRNDTEDSNQHIPKVQFEIGGNSSFRLDDEDETGRFGVLKKGLSLRHFNESMRDLFHGGSVTAEKEEEKDDTESYVYEQWVQCYSQQFHKLQFTESDMQSLVEDERAFRTLQMSLKQRKCTTNMYLSQTVHFYMKHVKDIRRQRELEGDDELFARTALNKAA